MDMNLDKIETQEEKEAFESMSNERKDTSPMNGEWWMCNRGGVEVVFLRLDDEWRGDSSDTYSYNNVVPLYKMIKSNELTTTNADFAEHEVNLSNDSLPSVGVECEYFHQARGLWVKFIPLLITNKENSPNKIPAVYGEWYHPNDHVWEPDLIDLIDEPKFRKPETPEQKAERERVEAAYDLYCECVVHGSGGAIGFETFKSSNIVNLTWLRIVDKTGYRKQNG